MKHAVCFNIFYIEFISLRDRHNMLIATSYGYVER